MYVKTVTENASFQKFSPQWRFLKTLASRLRVDGRKWRFSNTLITLINYILLTLGMLCEECCRFNIV